MCVCTQCFLTKCYESTYKNIGANFSIPARILITGGTGLLGLNWAMTIKHTQDVTLGIHHRHVQFPGIVSQKLSLESVDKIISLLLLILLH